MKKITASVSFMPKDIPGNTAKPDNTDFSALNALFSSAKRNQTASPEQSNTAAPAQKKDVGHDIFSLPDEYKLQ